MEESRKGLSIEVIGDELIRTKGIAEKELTFENDLLHISANHSLIDYSGGTEGPASYPETHLYVINKSAIGYMSMEYNHDDCFWYLTIYTDAICYEFRYVNSTKPKMIEDFSSIYKWVWGTFPSKKVLYSIEGPLGKMKKI